MAESILNELRLLVKKQTRLQEKVHHSLVKAEKLIEYSHEEKKHKMQKMTEIINAASTVKCNSE